MKSKKDLICKVTFQDTLTGGRDEFRKILGLPFTRLVIRIFLHMDEVVLQYN